MRQMGALFPASTRWAGDPTSGQWVCAGHLSPRRIPCCWQATPLSVCCQLPRRACSPCGRSRSGSRSETGPPSGPGALLLRWLLSLPRKPREMESPPGRAARTRRAPWLGRTQLSLLVASRSRLLVLRWCGDQRPRLPGCGQACGWLV